MRILLGGDKTFFDLGRLAVTFAFPSAVRGPVEQPPCHLQRRLPGTLSAVQGFPSRRRLPPHFTRAHAGNPAKSFALARTGGKTRRLVTGELLSPSCARWRQKPRQRRPHQTRSHLRAPARCLVKLPPPAEG